MKKTIVIVDDHVEMLDAYVEILENSGIKVIPFSDVNRAKQYLMTSTEIDQIDAIVSDMLMAPSDGLEFLSFIKRVPELADIDFYFITGTAFTLFEPYYRGFKIKGVIQKPFSTKILIETLTGYSSAKDIQIFPKKMTA